MYTFNVTSYRRTPKGAKVREGQFSLNKDKIKFEDGKWMIHLGYGYESHYGNLCREGFDSACPGQTYRLFHQWQPHKGDIIVDIKSGRKFVVGEKEGFCIYTAPLIEGDKVVALLKFEDYYKD